jgi:hypothetical protein
MLLILQGRPLTNRRSRIEIISKQLLLGASYGGDIQPETHMRGEPHSTGMGDSLTVKENYIEAGPKLLECG